MHLDVSFLNLPRKLAKDRGLTVVKYGAQKVALHLSNASQMLTVEKIEHAPVLMEARSLQNPVKPYRKHYKTIVDPKQLPNCGLGWLLRSVSSSQPAPVRIPSSCGLVLASERRKINSQPATTCL